MATRMFDRRPAAATADPHERVATIVARHGDLLFRVARHYALCADDAHDAVQRALEIYMRRVDSLDPATELAWLKVVVKHESLAVRRGRAGVASEDVDLDAVPAEAQRSVEERFESNERVERSAEVMRRLKRDEARALMLKAEGLSYNEIGERLGWTYTKVNRCITEGRRRFMRLYEELETGVECERLAPTLQALATGTASSEALLELRPHLRNCAGCRATVRALHTSHLGRLSAFAAALLAPARAFVERLKGGTPTPDAPVELQPAGPPGGARRVLPPHQRRRVRGPADRALGCGGRRTSLNRPHQPPRLGRDRTPPPPELRPRDQRPRRQHRRRRPNHLHRRPHRNLRQRRRRGDLLRGDRAPPGPEAGDPERSRSPRSARPPRRSSSASRHPPSQAAVRTPTPVPTRAVRHTPRPTTKSTPKSHEQAPISPAQASTQDFSFEQTADPAPVAPAAAPATGGGEFEP